MVAQHGYHRVFRIRERSLGLHQEVRPIETLTFTAVTRIVFRFAGKGAGATTIAFSEVNDHSKSCHDFYSCSWLGAITPSGSERR